ncbi:hypothetical protein SAMN05518861_12615 [Mesorhizobium sp. YR577]|nr:hypothetical protein SAMN05518861_12615 [Mesorhizobium sp. YR577]
MKSRRTPQPSIYYPEELQMLSRVCRRVCRERGIETNDREAKEIAHLAFILYSAGLCEEKPLIGKLGQQA